MLNPLNSLFGRLALLMVGLIVLVHGTELVLVMRERGQIDAEHAKRGILLAVYAREHREASAAQIVNTLGIHYVDVQDGVVPGCPAPCNAAKSPFDKTLLTKLPEGSRAVSDDDSGAVWVRYGEASYWLYLGNTLLPRSLFVAGYALTLLFAVMLALIGAWQFQRPLRRLVEAARQFRTTHMRTPVAEKGPTEFRVLIAGFNEMTEALVRAEHERAVMLAGVAHDLRAPISRMIVRAELLDDAGKREGFLRDAESLQRIVTQFLDYSRDAGSASALVDVDAHCQELYADGECDGLAVRLDLQAGEGFCLPAVDVDRILSNLLGNVASYGAGPVDISTRRHTRHYVLSVRDHGKGIPDDRLEDVLQPFVRLDRESGGDAHCGLGLSIVRKLVQMNRGQVDCCNAADGGFVVNMRFPSP
jgi:two-component system, OmpR family, osmolarity sensor histidine kinase EnvZ